MTDHLELGLVLVVASNRQDRYSWAVVETDKEGYQVGKQRQQWELSCDFVGTSCVLIDTLELSLRYDDDDLTNGIRTPTAVNRQLIRIQLRPGVPLRYETGHPTQYSMFGTNRLISNFELDVIPMDDDTEQEKCTAWGEASFTYEIDYRNETTEDRIDFRLYVRPATFERYAAKVSSGQIDGILFRVGTVPGFYSAFTPFLRTNQIKVLCAGKQQQVVIPSGVEVDIQRLGKVDQASLTFTRGMKFDEGEST